MLEVKTVGLFVITAFAEIVGCYLPYLWLREDKSPWLLIPAAFIFWSQLRGFGPSMALNQRSGMASVWRWHWWEWASLCLHRAPNARFTRKVI